MAIFAIGPCALLFSSTIDAEIPSQKRKIDLRLTDYLFVCWGCGRNEIFWQWAMRFHGLLCIRTDGMLSTDYSPVSLLFGSREKKQKQLAIHTAHSSSSHVHTHHDEFRACASALNNNNNKKKTSRDFHGLARLSCIYRSIHPCL